MIINSNMPSLKIHKQVTAAHRSANTAMQRLSTGIKINSAADDPSGLAIANRIRREISGISTVSQNALDGISITQTADSALGEIQNILQRIRELSVQGASGTQAPSDKEKIQIEIDELLDAVEYIGKTTSFNNKPLFSGVFEQCQAGNTNNNMEHGQFTIRVGQNKDNLMYMNFGKISIDDLGLDGMSVIEDSDDAINRIDAAIDQVSLIRSNIGAYENRLTNTSSVLEATSINMQAGLSRMLDTDMALEMSNLTQQNVISQAGISVMAQANQRPNQILQLL